MHVAFVTETFRPEINGVAMTCGRLVDGLRQRGHRIDVIRPRQPGEALGRHGETSDMLVRGLPLPGYPGLQLGMPQTRQLLAQWRARRPDIVHVVTEGPLGWSATAAARKLDIPTSSGFHTNFDRYSAHYRAGFLRPMVSSYLRIFHRRTQATMVPTETLAAELAGAGIPGLHVIRRGVDTELFSPRRRSEVLRRAWGVGERQLAVIYVGRIAAEKNIALALRAFSAIEANHPDARFILVGDGPLRESLARQHPRHHFAGARVGVELAEHYASADLFLFPSLTETFGNVTLEAMASGVPVMAYRSAAAAELIRDGASGRTVMPGDEGAFIAESVTLAADPVARTRYARQALQVAEANGWSDVVGSFEAMLAALREGRGGARLATA